MAEGLSPRVRERAVVRGRRVLDGEIEEETLRSLLRPHGYLPRIREEDGDAVLICYPIDWEGDGQVDPAAIDDLDRAIELPLRGSTEAEWELIAEENAAVVEAVAARHGEEHAANVAAFADFMNNHRARPITHATDADVAEFLTEYYPRNAWPSETQAALVEESVALARHIAESL